MKHARWAILANALVACVALRCGAQDSPGGTALESAVAAACKTVPATQPAVGVSADGVTAMFYDGPSWHGKPTRVFAWYGLPADLKPGQKVPGVVLVHGGGGTAFARWVRMWTKHGYAAIAMDTCGHIPSGKAPKSVADEQGGPPGWGGFDQVDEPVTDQWPYHAVMDVVLANSLLRSFPQVDADQIGINGISWGGYLTCIAVSLDHRWKFAIPVYGCGFLGEDSAWLGDFAKMGPEQSASWLANWDPSHYLPQDSTPTLWVDSTNDVNYPLEILAKSYVLPPAPATRVTIVGMKHSHTAGWAPPEIMAYADGICQRGSELVKITGAGRDGQRVWASFSSATPIDSAGLNYTTDAGNWAKRKWLDSPAEVDTADGKVSAVLPQGTTAFFMNLTDHRGLIVSTELSTSP